MWQFELTRTVVLIFMHICTVMPKNWTKIWTYKKVTTIILRVNLDVTLVFLLKLVMFKQCWCCALLPKTQAGLLRVYPGSGVRRGFTSEVGIRRPCQVIPNHTYSPLEKRSCASTVGIWARDPTSRTVILATVHTSLQQDNIHLWLSMSDGHKHNGCGERFWSRWRAAVVIEVQNRVLKVPGRLGWN